MFGKRCAAVWQAAARKRFKYPNLGLGIRTEIWRSRGGGSIRRGDIEQARRLKLAYRDDIDRSSLRRSISIATKACFISRHIARITRRGSHHVHVGDIGFADKGTEINIQIGTWPRLKRAVDRLCKEDGTS